MLGDTVAKRTTFEGDIEQKETHPRFAPGLGNLKNHRNEIALDKNFLTYLACVMENFD